MKDCPYCSKKIDSDATECSCGYKFDGYKEKVSVDSTETISSSNNTTITDINVPFDRIVSTMVKWAIASIPAFIILLIIGFIFMLAVVSMAGGIGKVFSL